MHILQPKQTRLSPKDKDKLLEEMNITLAQLPKIKLTDPGVPEDSETGDVLKIERKIGDRVRSYYRVVV